MIEEQSPIVNCCQRVRFDTVFPNCHDCFQPRISTKTTTQTVMPLSTINNETAAIADGDTNLSRICFKEKEECRPSDSQLNTSE
ncbi:unnamed protein product [Rotaria sordida]|uniref:Uncharacterized protein n=1 Tax=Rotaria sordida TaxID=392033 RepID=A0A816F4E6_9BILA|nr:unnamed protein product [Rotaria sordida]CAF1657701.1 unnamed protein product [Rotaria sordida]